MEVVSQWNGEYDGGSHGLRFQNPVYLTQEAATVLILPNTGMKYPNQGPFEAYITNLTVL